MCLMLFVQDPIMSASWMEQNVQSGSPCLTVRLEGRALSSAKPQCNLGLADIAAEELCTAGVSPPCQPWQQQSAQRLAAQIVR